MKQTPRIEQQHSHHHLHRTTKQPAHQQLHQYLNAQIALDTPSTTHAPLSRHFPIKSIAQQQSAVVHKLNQELIRPEQKYERINSKILSVR